MLLCLFFRIFLKTHATRLASKNTPRIPRSVWSAHCLQRRLVLRHTSHHPAIRRRRPEHNARERPLARAIQSRLRQLLHPPRVFLLRIFFPPGHGGLKSNARADQAHARPVAQPSGVDQVLKIWRCFAWRRRSPKLVFRLRQNGILWTCREASPLAFVCAGDERGLDSCRSVLNCVDGVAVVGWGRCLEQNLNRSLVHKPNPAIATKQACLLVHNSTLCIASVT